MRDSGRPGAGKTEIVVSRVAAGILSASWGDGGESGPNGTMNAAASPPAAAMTTAAFATIALMLPLVPAEVTRMRYRQPEGPA